MYLFLKKYLLNQRLNYKNFFVLGIHQKKKKKKGKDSKEKLSKGHEWTIHQREITIHNKCRGNLFNLINNEITGKTMKYCVLPIRLEKN